MDCDVCGCPKVRWLVVRTVARQFKCSEKKVRRLIACGQLEAIKIVHEWRVDHESLDAFVSSHSLSHESESGKSDSLTTKGTKATEPNQQQRSRRRQRRSG